MKGMQEAVTCTVCTEVYQAGVREPVVLPCGHTFCRPCLATLIKTRNFLCPTCRQPHNNTQVDCLSVNYSLLSLSSSCPDFEFATCGEHGDDLRYLCCSCDLPLCSLCLYSSHPQGHNVKLATAYVKETKVALETQLKLFDGKIENTMEHMRSKFVKLVERVSELCKNSSNLHDCQLYVAQLFDEIRKVSSIESIKSVEKMIEELLAMNQIHTSSPSSGIGDMTVTKSSTVAEESKCKAAEQEKTANIAGAAAVQNEQEASGGSQAVGVIRRARLDCQDGRLLMHCLAHPADIRISLQLPSEVFLELSVGGKCLGRVYIHLWSHLRRAQQFLALCLGTLGPSYLGAKASNVVNKSENRECILFSSHLDLGKENSQAMFNNLEWGNAYRKPIVEGIVMQYDPMSLNRSHNTYRHVNNQANISSFVICTNGDPGSTSNCPFGEVLSGLGVLRAAVRHNPVTEVTITQCGLVLPSFSQSGHPLP